MLKPSLYHIKKMKIQKKGKYSKPNVLCGQSQLRKISSHLMHFPVFSSYIFEFAKWHANMCFKIHASTVLYLIAFLRKW